MGKESKKETREEKRERQVAEIHAALGMYVHVFEMLIYWIRQNCIWLTSRVEGSRVQKQQQLMHIVFYHNTMTADPLFQIYRAMIGERLNDWGTKISDEERAAIEGVLKQIARDFDKVVRNRNIHLHGTWFIGFGNESTEDWSKITFIKFKTSRKGLELLEGPKSVKEIEPLIDECERLTSFFMRFHSCLIFPGEPRVSRNFIRDGRAKNARWIIKPRETTTPAKN